VHARLPVCKGPGLEGSNGPFVPHWRDMRYRRESFRGMRRYGAATFAVTQATRRPASPLKPAYVWFPEEAALASDRKARASNVRSRKKQAFAKRMDWCLEKAPSLCIIMTYILRFR